MVIQPVFYDEFRCIGAACEDSCCQGWGISVDRATFEKYQGVTHKELGPRLRELVTIKNDHAENGYAAMQLSKGFCPFLSDGLCEIHKQLGEEYLSQTCASYPRMIHKADESEERSLHLSCPEAARLTLMREQPMELGKLDGGVRRLVINLLQCRKYPVAKRLILVGHVCDKWSELAAQQASEQQKRQFLEAFAVAVNAGLYDAHLEQCSADPARQLKTLLELLVARMEMDYTSPSYLSLYREFVDGLELKAGDAPEAFGARYSEAYRSYYVPFMARHEYMMEQYLVAYAFKNLFPLGLAPMNGLLKLPEAAGIYVAQYLLLATYFALAKGMMIGLAGKYKSEFGAEHVVRCVYSISRTMEHCGPFGRRVLEFLGAKGVRSCSGVVGLTAN